jgi:hypothetical protein
VQSRFFCLQRTPGFFMQMFELRFDLLATTFNNRFGLLPESTSVGLSFMLQGSFQLLFTNDLQHKEDHRGNHETKDYHGFRDSNQDDDCAGQLRFFSQSAGSCSTDPRLGPGCGQGRQTYGECGGKCDPDFFHDDPPSRGFLL